MYVQGTSMLPLVRPGDVALIRRDKLENMRSGDVVLFQRGAHLLAKRIGEDGAAPSEDSKQLSANLDDREQADGRNEPEECLGQIVRLHRQAEEIDLSNKETPIEALVSLVLKPARRVKQSLRLSNEASS